MVVDQRMSSTFSRNLTVSAKPSFAAACERQSKRQTVRSCGVVSTFTQKTFSSFVKMPSVRVPPTSMSTVHKGASSGAGFQNGGEFVREHGPAEEGFDIIYGGFLGAGGAGGHGGVGEEDGPVIEKKGAANGGFDADVCGDAGEKKVLDAAGAQTRIEGGADETAVASFGDDDVRGKRREVVNNGGVPSALGENFSFQFGALVDETHGFLFVPIGGIGAAAVALVGFISHLQVDDGDAGGAGRVEDGADEADHTAAIGDIEPGDIEHAALAGKGILHVHEDDGGFFEAD